MTFSRVRLRSQYYIVALYSFAVVVGAAAAPSSPKTTKSHFEQIVLWSGHEIADHSPLQCFYIKWTYSVIVALCSRDGRGWRTLKDECAPKKGSLTALALSE